MKIALPEVIGASLLLSSPLAAEVIGGAFKIYNQYKLEENKKRIVSGASRAIRDKHGNLDHQDLTSKLYEALTASVQQLSSRNIPLEQASFRLSDEGRDAAGLQLKLSTTHADTSVFESVYTVAEQKPDTVRERPPVRVTGVTLGYGHNGRNHIASAGLEINKRLGLRGLYGIPDSRNPLPTDPILGDPDPFRKTRTSTVIDTTGKGVSFYGADISYMLWDGESIVIAPSAGFLSRNRTREGYANTEEIDANEAPLRDGYNQKRPFRSKKRETNPLLGLEAQLQHGKNGFSIGAYTEPNKNNLLRRAQVRGYYTRRF